MKKNTAFIRKRFFAVIIAAVLFAGAALVYISGSPDAALRAGASVKSIQKLAYCYGFEHSLKDEGWTTFNLVSGSGIKRDPHNKDNPAFLFTSTEHDLAKKQYLISPEIPETGYDLVLSFKCKCDTGTLEEKCQIGYSNITATSSFLWATDNVSIINDASWVEYSVRIPAHHKYIAIKYNTSVNNNPMDSYYGMYIDDIRITPFTTSYVRATSVDQITMENINQSTKQKSVDWVLDNLTMLRNSVPKQYSGAVFVFKQNTLLYSFGYRYEQLTVDYVSNNTEVVGAVIDNIKNSYSHGMCVFLCNEDPFPNVYRAPEANSLTYSGEPQTLAAQGTAVCGSMKYALGTNGTSIPESGWGDDIPQKTDAGTYYLWYRAESDTYVSVPACVEVQIAPLPVTVTAGSMEAEYSGEPLTCSTFTVSPEVSGLETVITSSITNAGTAPNVISSVNGVNVTAGEPVQIGNYTVTTVNGTLEVTKKSVTVKANDGIFTYNGLAHAGSGYEVTGLCGDDKIEAITSGSVTYPDETNAAHVIESYSFTAGDPDNYTVSTENGSLKVMNTNQKITLTSASDSWTYDGSAHSNKTVAVTEGALFSGDEIAVSAEKMISVTEAADSAEANNVFEYVIMNNGHDVTGNYAVTVVNGTLRIEPKNIDTADLALKFGDLTYNGGAKVPEVNLGGKTLRSGTEYTVKYRNAAGKDVDSVTGAGNYTVSVTGVGNYTGTAEKTVTVKSAEITVTANNKTSVRGSGLKALTWSLKGATVPGDDLKIALHTDANSDAAGRYVITVTASNDNYSITLVNGVYTVKDKILASEKAAAKQALFAGAKGVSSAKAVTLYWGKVPEADKIVVYASYCGSNNKYQKIAELKGSASKYSIKELNGEKLNQKRNVKAYIVAYRLVNGVYKRLAKSYSYHIAGYKTKNTNVKEIQLKTDRFSIKKGKSAVIKGILAPENSAKKTIKHTAEFRYYVSDSSIAAVDKNGKITAVGKGTCIVYVISNNGVTKAVSVKVR